MQQLKMSSNDVAQQLTTIQPPGSSITNTFVCEQGMGCVMIILLLLGGSCASDDC